MTPPPILIAAPARCGTTMLAWLLHLHGVWIGEGNITKAPETNPQVPTENTAIKALCKAPSGDFRKRVLDVVDTDGPWLVKTAALLSSREHWFRAFPDARWLLLHRPVDAVVASRMKHPGMRGRGEAENRRRAVEQFKMQRDVAGSAKHAMMVSADALCSGGEQGEEEARAVFRFVGLAFDPFLYHDWVQPERWHG